MKDIIEKLQALVYGKNRSVSENRNNVVIENNESLNKKLSNSKRS